MFILYSSKTHDQSNKPQTIKITELDEETNNDLDQNKNCPFQVVRECLAIRKPYKSDNEQFFVFSDRSPVTPEHYCKMLADLIHFNELDHTHYRVHDLCAGHATDMLEMGIPHRGHKTPW